MENVISLIWQSCPNIMKSLCPNEKIVYSIMKSPCHNRKVYTQIKSLHPNMENCLDYNQKSMFQWKSLYPNGNVSFLIRQNCLNNYYNEKSIS